MKQGHKRFYEILAELEELHSTKNSDYAEKSDPLSNLKMSEQIDIPGYVGNFIRMGDKWSRLVQLMKKKQHGEGPAVKNESMKDTLRDLAVYCILEMILLEEYEQKNKPG
jgi:hypothetical protein